MICRRQRILCCFALLVAMTAGAQAGQGSVAGKPGVKNTKVVRQADGSEVVRLADLDAEQVPAILPRSVPIQEQRLGPWLQEAAMEPRLMTALATLPSPPRSEGQNLPEGVDPSLVRSWAEFIDPVLALRWKTIAQMNGFSEALLQHPDNGTKGLKAGGAFANPLPGLVPRLNTGLSTTWSNVVSEGAKRSLSGQQALHEWLMLPIAEPKANPWLSSLGGYRY